MDWLRFVNPIGGGVSWRRTVANIGGRRYELFKEPLWKGWRFVTYWRFRASGVTSPGFYRTMRQAKAAAEYHASRRVRQVA